MGVPALFRWLSKKYPKIVQAVEEEHPRKVPTGDGEGEEELPVDMSRPNPNGEEFDCLYLDMNGIVHPCTHPEGKPAPETEEEMMTEVFAYTERVVNMIRPRRLLMMAIDGVAPRAKMNQQRSRRFRAAQEAKEKQEEKEKALEEWKAMGIPVTGEAAENKKAWDSNAITPGTPFMDLLAGSLRYWVARKMNQDPAWKDLQVVISDASVPGEGEHKIMDFIRRQRSQPEHDANTRHVIYGLDADLIMLSLATHEPHFKVLREDVFADEKKVRTCHRCGREGHIAANCIGEPKEKQGEHDDVGAKPLEKKPFIFLDVVTLREYLEVELNVPGIPFKFDLERAIDDWVFLIFFVGNDFLPHLPSLEIREGAIDNLLRIWKKELGKMGGYLTKHGKVELKNVQVILEGIAQQEDDIFRRRKEAEERADTNAKRRKVEDEARQRREMAAEGKNFKFGEQTYVEGRAPVPQKPSNGNDDDAEKLKVQALAALESGRSEDIVANQRAIRMANLSAAEKLKAELKGQAARTAGAAGKPADSATKDEAEKVNENTVGVKVADGGNVKDAGEDAVGFSAVSHNGTVETTAEQDDATTFINHPRTEDHSGITEAKPTNETGGHPPHITEADSNSQTNGSESTVARVAGQKRFREEVDEDAEVSKDIDNSKTDMDEGNETVDPVVETNVERKVKPDGTVEYEDTVKMWEPGYRERYYQQKFGVEASDTEFRRGIVKSYLEGMSWVLAYYYQGCPSWTWYYPYHFSPFAADFTDLESLTIEFDEGKPFRPYDQLMGVLPAASRASIPPIFHPLMTEPDSEIIDFYPESFSIDMNGKKMAWQGVALLPFIDETRLLKAINARYSQLSDDEMRRNSFGDHALLVADENKLYDELCALYAKRRNADEGDGGRAAINAANSGGITGSVRPDPDLVPNSTFISPLTSVGLEDILNDRSISAFYEFPPQRSPHRSILLKGVQTPKRRLTEADREVTRRGGADSRGGRRGGGPRYGGSSYNHHSIHADHQQRSVVAGGRGGGAMRFGDGPARGGAPNMHKRFDDGASHYGGRNGGRDAYGGGAQNADPFGGSYQQGGQYETSYQQPSHRQGYGDYGGYGGYGGYGASGGGVGGNYGGPQPPAAYAGYGGYGGGGGGGGYGAPQPPQAAYPQQNAYGAYEGASPYRAGSSGSYGDGAYGGGAYGGGAYGGGYGAGAGGSGGPYGAYGGGPPAPAPVVAPPAGPRHGGGGAAAPRPLGFRNGGPPGRGGGGGGGRGGSHSYGGGPYGRY